MIFPCSATEGCCAGLGRELGEESGGVKMSMRERVIAAIRVWFVASTQNEGENFKMRKDDSSGNS